MRDYLTKKTLTKKMNYRTFFVSNLNNLLNNTEILVMYAINTHRLPLSTDVSLKANICSYCLVKFHGRDVAAVDLKQECQTSCGHHFHLACLTWLFFNKPIGSRSCWHCGQNPFPVLDMKTGEAHLDKFFPDQVFSVACLNGDLDQVKKSLAEGVNVNAAMKDNYTALIIATLAGYTDIAEHLIKHGADVNAVQAFSRSTALHFAADQIKPIL